MLGYIHYWLSIRCPTPPSPFPPPARLTPFNLLEINSDWLTGRQHQLVEYIKMGQQRWGRYNIDRATGAYKDTEVTHPIIIQLSTHSIFPCFCSHSLFPRFCRSMQLCGSAWPGSIIPSHPLMLLEPEPLYLMNSFWMLPEVGRSVDDWLSAF